MTRKREEDASIVHSQATIGARDAKSLSRGGKMKLGHGASKHSRLCFDAKKKLAVNESFAPASFSLYFRFFNSMAAKTTRGFLKKKHAILLGAKTKCSRSSFLFLLFIPEFSPLFRQHYQGK